MRIHDKLGLSPGDYLEVELERGKVVMTPKTLVDKQILRAAGRVVTTPRETAS